MTATEFHVSGMSCGHCESAVRAEVTKIDGVRDVQVDAGSGLLRITSTGDIDVAAVRSAVDEAGYDLEPAG